MSTATLSERLNGDSTAVRQAKSRAKRGLREGRVELVDVLRDPPQALRLDETLLALPGIRESKLRSTCEQTGLYARAHLDSLTEQERGRLVLFMRERGWIA